MFARFTGEEGTGLTSGEVYFIEIAEHYIKETRVLNIRVGDYWAENYSSLGEAMMEWDFKL